MNRFVTVVFVTLALITACGGNKVDSLDDFLRTTTEMDEYTKAISEKRNSINDLLQAYNQTVPKARRLELRFAEDGTLPDSERDRLDSHLNEETDESCRLLLKRIPDIADEIDALVADVKICAATLPAPHKVRRGDNHTGICRGYLRDAVGLCSTSTDSVLRKARLQDELLEGFDVYMYYDSKGGFATYIAQGNAKIAPLLVQRMAIKTRSAHSSSMPDPSDRGNDTTASNGVVMNTGMTLTQF